jgi:release factor glutamine methyltransferase
LVALLLEHFTGYNHLFINLHPDTEIDLHTMNDIHNAVCQLLENVPVQYVLGETTFCDIPVFVDASVLIPRPETEELTLWIIDENPHANKLIDICTGSGCIAVSLANYIKDSIVYAVDISAPALEIARKNALYNHVRLYCICFDILDPKFMDILNVELDVIVSNPPYVREMEKQYIHDRVLNYEPHLALFVKDDDPLLFYRVLLEYGRKRLADNGKLYVEINENYGKELVSLFAEYGYEDIRLREDIHGKDRMICGIMKQK